MTTLELVLNMLAEATTTEISKKEQPQTFEENKQVARSGGKIAGNARHAIEKRTGKPVITPKKAIDFSQIIIDMIEEKDNKTTTTPEEKK
jgi:citrate synthase